jgi:hypothetical protein
MIQTADSLNSTIAQTFNMLNGLITTRRSGDNKFFFSRAVPENSLLTFGTLNLGPDGPPTPALGRVYCEAVSFEKAWFHGYLVLIYVSLELELARHGSGPLNPLWTLLWNNQFQLYPSCKR